MRTSCTSYRHAAGSCRMGHDGDEGAVVDHRYRVIGTDNLSVVDASVMPDATSSNTNPTVIAIAHRAATLL
jgi:choline dehydrogenase-like flavoprotein